MGKNTYKFISQEEIESGDEPIVFVIYASFLNNWACNFIGDDREFTDVQINRIAREMFDSFDLDIEPLSVMEEVFRLDDIAWKEVDDKFKAKQESLKDSVLQATNG
jgi:hypothetical protein